MKYVIVNKSGIEFAILLPESVEHAEAVDREKLAVLGAGFCSVEPGTRVQAWGESTSLKVKSRGEEDAQAIEFSLMNMGLLRREGRPLTARILESGAQGGDQRLAVGADESHPARVAGVTSRAGVATGPLSC